MQALKHDTSVYILAVDSFIAIESLRIFPIYWNCFKTLLDKLNQNNDLLITFLPQSLKTGLIPDFSSESVKFRRTHLIDISQKRNIWTLVMVIHKFKVYSVLFTLVWWFLRSIKHDIPVKQVLIINFDRNIRGGRREKLIELL